MFRLDNNMAYVCVYGIAIAVEVSANCLMRSPNIFRSSAILF